MITRSTSRDQEPLTGTSHHSQDHIGRAKVKAITIAQATIDRALLRLPHLHLNTRRSPRSYHHSRRMATNRMLRLTHHPQSDRWVQSTYARAVYHSFPSRQVVQRRRRTLSTNGPDITSSTTISRLCSSKKQWRQDKPRHTVQAHMAVHTALQ